MPVLIVTLLVVESAHNAKGWGTISQAVLAAHATQPATVIHAEGLARLIPILAELSLTGSLGFSAVGEVVGSSKVQYPLLR